MFLTMYGVSVTTIVSLIITVLRPYTYIGMLPYEE